MVEVRLAHLLVHFFVAAFALLGLTDVFLCEVSLLCSERVWGLFHLVRVSLLTLFKLVNYLSARGHWDQLSHFAFLLFIIHRSRPRSSLTGPP